jgi:hypothetical protein
VRRGIRHAKPVIDLKDEILDNGDRGLLSVAIDPEFATNGWIYLLYIVDPAGDGSDSAGPSFGRLTRYTTAIDVNGDLLADPASRTVLIGASWPEGIPSIHLSHSVGDLRFSEDGSLFVSTGDGAHYDLTDLGGNDPGGFGTGKFDASEDVGAFRSQTVTSLAGKILRIDPATGLGLPDNPWFTGSAADNASRVWAMGLRNPFRFTLKPGSKSPGRLDQRRRLNTWEELDNCTGGENWLAVPQRPTREPLRRRRPVRLLRRHDDLHQPDLDLNHPTRRAPASSGSAAPVLLLHGQRLPAGLRQPPLLLRLLVELDPLDRLREREDDRERGLRRPDRQPHRHQSGRSTATSGSSRWRTTASTGSAAPGRTRRRSSRDDHADVRTSPLAVTLDATASSFEGLTLTYDWDLGGGTHASTPVMNDVYPLGQTTRSRSP